MRGAVVLRSLTQMASHQHVEGISVDLLELAELLPVKLLPMTANLI